MKNDEVKITKTNENKSFWINKDFVSEDLKKELTTANIIFILDAWKGDENIAFHRGAQPFCEFLEEQEIDDLNIGFCCDDENYKEIHLHSDTI